MRKAPKIKIIPEKYASPVTSGLAEEVKAESNTFNFELEDGPPGPVAKKAK